MSFDTFDTDSVATAGLTFSGGNLTVLGAAGTSLTSSGNAMSLEGKTAGKWYVEFTCVAVSGNVDGVGVASSCGVGSSAASDGFLGADQNSQGWGYYTNSHVVNGASAVTAVNNATFGAGDVIGVAIDLTNNSVWFNKNGGAWVGTSGTPNPATNTSGFSLASMRTTGPNGFRAYPCVNLSGSAAKFTANFGGSSFTGTVPSGFTGGWTNTTAGTYFGTFANSGHGSSYVSAGPSGDKAVSKYTSGVTGNIASITFPFSSNVSGTVTGLKAVVYADSSGVPGALLAVSTNVIGPVSNISEYTFNFSGLSATSGTAYWVGIVETGSGNMAMLCPPETNGIYYNAASTYASPSNPFGALPSTANFRYPIIANVTAPPAATPHSQAGMIFG